GGVGGVGGWVVGGVRGVVGGGESPRTHCRGAPGISGTTPRADDRGRQDRGRPSVSAPKNARWQALKDKWAELPDWEKQWAMRLFTDEEGMVQCRPLLSGDVSTWASEVIWEQERRGERAR